MGSYIGVLTKSYLELKNKQPGDPELHARALIKDSLYLGLFRWWQGREEEARALFAETTATAQTLLGRILPDLSPTDAIGYALPTELGAMAASLSGQEQVSRKLFAQAELFATGLVTGQEPVPENALQVLNKPNAILPYIRVYSLIRLGRLSGFNAFIYTVPLPEAHAAAPVWTRTDIHHALDTASLCSELWRTQRGGEDYLKQKKLEPLLRALVACLAPSAGEPERAVARQALSAYQDSIHDLYYFSEIYPRVLDLQVAYPHIFGTAPR